MTPTSALRPAALLPVMLFALSHSGAAFALLEEVIVTAQKRLESASGVPIAINTLSGNMLDDFGVRNGDDLIALYPNLSLKASTSINSGFSIRGVGTDNFHVTAQQAVGTYADEVSLPSPFTSQFALFDMDRVEVLRGPQNALFGRNTTGGAVNFISRKPQAGGDLNGFARITAGNKGQQELEAATGIPVGDTLAARIAVQTVNRDGSFHDLVDDEEVGLIERHSGRAQLMWQPGTATEILINLHAGYNRSDRGPRKALGFWQADSPNIGTPNARGAPDCPLLFSSSFARFEGPNSCVTANNDSLINPSTTDWHDVYDAANTRANVDFEGGFVKLTHELTTMTLTSISSYDTIEVDFVENTSAFGSPGFYPAQDARYAVFSQELRLTSTQDGWLRWIGGLYYSREDDTLATIIRNGADGTPAFTIVPSVAVQQDVDVYSVYGQLEVDLNSSLTLTAGLRYTDDRKQGESTSRVIAATRDGRPGPALPADFYYDLDFLEDVTADVTARCPPAVGGLPCVLGPIPVEQKLQEYGGKLGLDWQVCDDSLLYVSYSRGFKSGAFDTRATAVFAGNGDKPVAPEFLDAYELGAKLKLLDNTVQLNGAVFYYDWKDLQTFATDATGSAAFLNIPKTRLTGAEVDVVWVTHNGWTVQAGLGLLDSEITDSGGLSRVKDGAPLSASPAFTLTGLLQKEIALAAGTLSLQTTFNHSDEYYSGFAKSPLERSESVTLVNARAAWVFGARQQYELALAGENLTAEKTCAVIGEEGGQTNVVTCLANQGIAFYALSAQFNF